MGMMVMVMVFVVAVFNSFVASSQLHKTAA